MAISTYQVFLMRKSGVGEYTKVTDIKDFPDLGGTPETLDTTTLSDPMSTSIPGIQSVEALAFSANYDKSEYTKIKTYEEEDKAKESKDDTDYAVWFGGDESQPDEYGRPTPTGDKGKFNFKGKLSAHTTGGGTNEVVGIAISIAPSTPITFE
jgi:hypothetical protein